MFYVGKSLQSSADGSIRSFTNSRNLNRFPSIESIGTALAPQRGMTLEANQQCPRTFVRLNGDKRSGIETRRFSYHAHIPERRSGLDRRSERESRELAAGGSNETALG